jgi:hypothetical protein
MARFARPLAVAAFEVVVHRLVSGDDIKRVGSDGKVHL